MHACIHAYLLACMHTCIHTKTHACICTYMYLFTDFLIDFLLIERICRSVKAQCCLCCPCCCHCKAHMLPFASPGCCTVCICIGNGATSSRVFWPAKKTLCLFGLKIASGSHGSGHLAADLSWAWHLGLVGNAKRVCGL